MIAGGADSKINPLAFVRYQLLGKLIATEGDPKKSYKVFDEKRSSMSFS